jgi:hypothetical protein
MPIVLKEFNCLYVAFVLYPLGHHRISFLIIKYMVKSIVWYMPHSKVIHCSSQRMHPRFGGLKHRSTRCDATKFASEERGKTGLPLKSAAKKATMTTRLQLSLSAKGLKNLSGILQKSDPFAVVTVRGDNPDNNPEVVGRTDV